MLEEAARFPPAYDDDSPQLTREQLLQFRPVNVSAAKRPQSTMVAESMPFYG
jgi:hypothetical protein